jgi:hypothetical protein
VQGPFFGDLKVKGPDGKTYIIDFTVTSPKTPLVIATPPNASPAQAASILKSNKEAAFAPGAGADAADSEKRRVYDSRYFGVPFADRTFMVLAVEYAGALAKDTKANLRWLAGAMACSAAEDPDSSEDWCPATKKRYSHNVACLLSGLEIPLSRWRARALLEACRRAKLGPGDPQARFRFSWPAVMANGAGVVFNGGPRSPLLIEVPDYLGVAVAAVAAQAI